MIEKIKYSIALVGLMLFFIACKKSSAESKTNTKPIVTIKAALTNAALFTYQFTAVATDPDNDPLEYEWNFGEGTVRKGAAVEDFSFTAGKEYIVRLAVNDKVNAPVEVSITINAKTTEV